MGEHCKYLKELKPSLVGDKLHGHEDKERDISFGRESRMHRSKLYIDVGGEESNKLNTCYVNDNVHSQKDEEEEIHHLYKRRKIEKRLIISDGEESNAFNTVCVDDKLYRKEKDVKHIPLLHRWEKKEKV